MSEAQELMLHPDVEILPVESLDETTRSRLGGSGDFVLNRRRSRHASSLASAAMVRLIERFRQPVSLVDALLAESREVGRPATELLEGAHDVLSRLLRTRVLVRAADDIEDEAKPSLTVDEPIQGMRVQGLLRTMEDVELYRVRHDDTLAVLKLRRHANPGDRSAIAVEVAALERAPTGVSVRLLQHGQWRDRPYLVTEYFPGCGLDTAAGSLRGTDRSALFDLVSNVSRAYSELHGAGVLHGDVHPENILVARRDQRVRLVDFGQAVLRDEVTPPFGCVAYYLAPEQARALAADRTPKVTAQSEQYALAAVLYRAITGDHYAAFQISRERMLEQIMTTLPRSFDSLAIAPWPAMEAVLRRALAKRAADRFPDLDAFARAVAAAAPVPSVTCTASAAPAAARRDLEAVCRSSLRDTAVDGDWWQSLTPPRAPVMKGAAGVALGLYRQAIARQDMALLSRADQWARRAMAWAERADGLAEPGQRPVAVRNPYHGASGVAATQALIAAASGHQRQFAESTRAFIDASDHSSEGLDLTLGDAGTLAGCATLYDRAAMLGSPLREPLAELAEAELEALWRRLADQPLLAVETGYAGVAHGWAGYLYATLSWCTTVGRQLPPDVEQRLGELRQLAAPAGRGACWPVHLGRAGGVYGNALSGWCHGSAGYVLLWCLAADATGDEGFLTPAEEAAWHAWDDPGVAGSLCCGLVGRAYALLGLYRATGAVAWLRRAEQLSTRACRDGRFGAAQRHDLFKGQWGLAVLAADIARPVDSRFPWFEEAAGGAGAAASAKMA